MTYTVIRCYIVTLYAKKKKEVVSTSHLITVLVSFWINMFNDILEGEEYKLINSLFQEFITLFD